MNEINTEDWIQMVKLNKTRNDSHGSRIKLLENKVEIISINIVLINEILENIIANMEMVNSDI